MSLWTEPQKKPVKVDLRKRFGGYPHFVYSFDQYVDLHVPKVVPVVWKPLKQFLEIIDTCNEFETETTLAWIGAVKTMIAEGEDVPPMLINEGRVFDGRHRSWAAHRLGIKKAPVVDLTPYWHTNL